MRSSRQGSVRSSAATSPLSGVHARQGSMCLDDVIHAASAASCSSQDAPSRPRHSSSRPLSWLQPRSCSPVTRQDARHADRVLCLRDHGLDSASRLHGHARHLDDLRGQMGLASGEEERSARSRGRGAGEQLIHLIPEADHLNAAAHLTPSRPVAQALSASSSWYTNAVGIHPFMAHKPHAA